MFGGLLVLVVVQIASGETVYVTSLFIGPIGGATTFASAKVKKAIGRIGIFLFKIVNLDLDAGMFNI